jgi:hypothetical protein
LSLYGIELGNGSTFYFSHPKIKWTKFEEEFVVATQVI